MLNSSLSLTGNKLPVKYEQWQELSGWKLSPVVFYRQLRLRNTT